jgi:hypothetical protein
MGSIPIIFMSVTSQPALFISSGGLCAAVTGAEDRK